MNDLEFKTIMDLMGFSKKAIKEIGNKNQKVEFYIWGNFQLFFNGRDCTVLEGAIPLEFAQKFYDKYSGNPYLVWMDGRYNDDKPLDCATSEEYKRFKTATYDVLSITNKMKQYAEILKIKKLDIAKENLESLYIEDYYIHTKEGLVIMITELQDYIIGKTLNNPSFNMQTSKQKDLITEVNKRLIRKCDFSKSTEEWIEDNNSSILRRTKEHISEDEKIQEIRRLLDIFDEKVNPFVNSGVDTLEPVYFGNDIFFSCYGDEDSSNFRVTDKNDKVESSHTVGQDYMTYRLSYGDEPCRLINHYYCNKRKNGEEPGEELYLSMDSKDNKESEIDLRYNLTKGTAYRTYAKEYEKKPITSEQKDLIISELNKAIVIAETLNAGNLNKLQNQDDVIKSFHQ